MKTIAHILLAAIVCSGLLALPLHAEEQVQRYIVVLKQRSGAAPDVASLGGKIEFQQDDQLVVTIPPGALAALKDEAHIRKTVANNLAGAAWMLEHLSDAGISAVPTSANFIYFELQEPAAEFAKRMQAEGVIVRPLGPWGIRNGVRVTIGTPEQNEMFVRTLKKVLQPVTP